MLSKSYGPLLVAVAALLWATDAVYRFPMVGAFDPTVIVFAEHLLGVLILFPWLYLRTRKTLFRMRAGDWVSAALIGMGGSAFATVLFTASFAYINPSVSILLQKLQPVAVVLLAFIFLGERPDRRFFIWSPVALIAGVVLSFPTLDFSFLTHGLDPHSKGVTYSLVAAALWAAATIGGKSMLRRTSPSIATFWRYFFGLVAITAMIFLAQIPIPWKAMATPPLAQPLLYVSLVPGVLAMLAYYGGLAWTPASVTTFIELIFPIGAVILNTIFLHTPLNPVQIAAGAVLLVAVAKISIATPTQAKRLKSGKPVPC